MTNGRFELAENWQSNNNASADEAYLALHNESFDRANVINIADKTGKGKTGDTSLAAQAAEQPTTKAEKLAMDALTAFGAAKTPAEGMKAAEEKFKGAVKQADDDFDPTMKSCEAEAKKLMPAYQKAEAAVQAADANLQTKFQQVPEGEQKKVETMLQLWAQLDPNNQVRQAIGKELGKYPGLMPAAEGMEKAANAPAISQMEALKAKAETALEDRVNTRMIYGEALKATGRNAESDQQIKDAAKILGIDVPQDKPLKGMIEAQMAGKT